MDKHHLIMFNRTRPLGKKLLARGFVCAEGMDKDVLRASDKHVWISQVCGRPRGYRSSNQLRSRTKGLAFLDEMSGLCC